MHSSSQGWRWGLFLTVMAVGDVQGAQDCAAIVSPLKRLECFDLIAGTPIHPAPAPASAPSRVLPIIELVQRNEAKRAAEEQRFLLSVFPAPDNPFQQSLVISAPALNASAPGPHLAISCEANITRLQLVLDEPASTNRIAIRVFKDDRPISATYQWQVLDDAGLVLDAGRGLQAIALVRNMGEGQRLQLQSDYPRLNGLEFAADGLSELIQQERQACRW